MVEKPMLIQFQNGNIQILWESFRLSSSIQTSNLRVSYEISITNDAANDNCSELLYFPDSSLLSYNYNPRLQCDSQGQCLTFTVTITPIINNETSGERTNLLTGAEIKISLKFLYRNNITVFLLHCNYF